MKQFEYTVKDPVGIHARPAGQIVKLAKEYGSEIQIAKGEKSAGATKLMMLMGLGVKCGDTISVTVNGEDEEAAAKAMEQFLEENL